MTEEEVQQIYDYLHENYRYEDGELIRKKDCKLSGKKSGSCLGSFFYASGKGCMRCGITVNGVKIYKPLAHFIFLFHYKKLPLYIEFKDGNIVNCKIENIFESNASQIENKKIIKKGYEKIKTSNGIRYRVSISTKNKNVRRKMHFGSYESKEKAILIYSSAKKLYQQGKTETEIKTELKILFPEIKIKEYKIKNSLPGVHAIKNKFKSSVCINKRSIYLGTFNTPEEAHAAYLKAKEEYAQRT